MEESQAFSRELVIGSRDNLVDVGRGILRSKMKVNINDVENGKTNDKLFVKRTYTRVAYILIKTFT